MTLSIIAILSDNNVIGRGNRLPFRQSNDLKRFKALTMGHHLLMGRKTYESLEYPLPGRTIVVITHDREFHPDGILTAPSIERAIDLARLDDEPFIAGGGQIFEQSLHRADRMYLTRVHAEIEGDAFFPEFDDVTEWDLVDAEHREADEKNQYPYSFLTYERAGKLA
ncbi:MAG TPA: dihydrofolate reductase [Thermoanaerobaculia bacterium]|nr:dihydrofolate reductase [Thermoanaerobaculia bacterium]